MTDQELAQEDVALAQHLPDEAPFIVPADGLDPDVELVHEEEEDR